MSKVWPLAVLSLAASLIPLECHGGIKIPFKKEKPSQAFRAEFEKTWQSGVTHAVVVVDGIPASPPMTTAEAVGGGTEGVDIKDGVWKRSGGFFDRGMGDGMAIEETLRRGEVVSLPGRGCISYKEDRIEIYVRSIGRHEGGKYGGGTVGTVFKFFFPTSLETTPMPEVLAYIERYLKPMGTREQAQAGAAQLGSAETKTVRLGQTRQEVEGLLGKPAKAVDLGPKVIYVYADMKVVFANGKVADVQ